jgi:hypothetical protein
VLPDGGLLKSQIGKSELDNKTTSAQFVESAISQRKDPKFKLSAIQRKEVLPPVNQGGMATMTSLQGEIKRRQMSQTAFENKREKVTVESIPEGSVLGLSEMHATFDERFKADIR